MPVTKGSFTAMARDGYNVMEQESIDAFIDAYGATYDSIVHVLADWEQMKSPTDNGNQSSHTPFTIEYSDEQGNSSVRAFDSWDVAIAEYVRMGGWRFTAVEDLPGADGFGNLYSTSYDSEVGNQTVTLMAHGATPKPQCSSGAHNFNLVDGVGGLTTVGGVTRLQMTLHAPDNRTYAQTSTGGCCEKIVHERS